MRKLMELQEAFQELREENSRLHEERRQVRARSRYERRRFGKGVALVQAGEDGDGLPCCPKCRDGDGLPLPLQGMTAQFTAIATHMCPSCSGTFNLTLPRS